MISRGPRTDRIVGVCAIILWLIMLALATVGCSALGPSLAEKADDVVERYCARPIADRLVLRAVVNRELAPHRIEVICAGDPPPPASSPADPEDVSSEIVVGGSA